MEVLSQFNGYHAAFVLIALGLSTIAIWSRRRIGPKVAAVVLFAALMTAGYGALADLLGRPKPVLLEWFKATAEDVEVIASDARENEAIYLWLRFPDGGAPRAYALPWNLEMAKRLHGAKAEAAQDGRGLRMRGQLGSEGDEVTEPVFYPEPQPALPPKQPPAWDSYATPSRR